MERHQQNGTREFKMDKPLHKIRLLLHDLEKSFGRVELTAAERDVLYVIENLAEEKPIIASQDILAHDLTNKISRQTIYRSLKTLPEKNFIVKSNIADRGFCTLNSET